MVEIRETPPGIEGVKNLTSNGDAGRMLGGQASKISTILKSENFHFAIRRHFGLAGSLKLPSKLLHKCTQDRLHYYTAKLLCIFGIDLG